MRVNSQKLKILQLLTAERVKNFEFHTIKQSSFNQMTYYQRKLNENEFLNCAPKKNTCMRFQDIKQILIKAQII